MLFTLVMNNSSDKFQKRPPAMGEIGLHGFYLYVFAHTGTHTRVCEREKKTAVKEETCGKDGEDGHIFFELPSGILCTQAEEGNTCGLSS